MKTTKVVTLRIGTLPGELDRLKERVSLLLAENVGRTFPADASRVTIELEAKPSPAEPFNSQVTISWTQTL